VIIRRLRITHFLQIKHSSFARRQHTRINQEVAARIIYLSDKFRWFIINVSDINQG
jgi:hypothetical protein